MITMAILIIIFITMYICIHVPNVVSGLFQEFMRSYTEELVWGIVYASMSFIFLALNIWFIAYFFKMGIHFLIILSDEYEVKIK